MNNNLKNLYVQLIENVADEKNRWHIEYSEFVGDIEKIKNSLMDSGTKSLDDHSIYKGTSFATKNNNAKDEFLQKLFANTSNGVASNGQSILSEKDREKLMANEDFLSCVAELIRDPILENHQSLREKWHELIDKNNPVLTNRVTAACTTNVSSCVDEGKFYQVFNWLIEKELITEYSENKSINNKEATKKNCDWFCKNEHVVKQITNFFQALKVDERKAFNKTLFGNEQDKNPDPYWINIFIWSIYENLSTPFLLKKQIVKYGPPGTGKTYIAKQNAKLHFNIWKEEFAKSDETYSYNKMVEVIQFHPSYSYEDFIEGLRPSQDGSLKLHNGVFKSLCKKAGRWEIDLAKIDQKLDVNKITLEELKKYKDKLAGEHWEYIWKFNKSSNDKTLLIDVLPPYFMIIDEINRAELSRVFGELMYCLEYRGTEGAIKTQYTHLNDESTGMLKVDGEYRFFIPEKLYILATMNTIDRSVESFDFALRRRFRWEEVLPNYNLLEGHLLEYRANWKGLCSSLEKLNKMIKGDALLGADYCIGHAYLMNLPYAKETSVTDVKEMIWEDSIKPLLTEYLRGTGKNVTDFKNEFLGKNNG